MPLLGEGSPTGRTGGITLRARPMRPGQQPIPRSLPEFGRRTGSLAGIAGSVEKHEAGILPGSAPLPSGGLGRLFSTCANPACSTGWLHLWRSRTAPVFEGGWSCSMACTIARLEAAIRRETEGRSAEPFTHRHRIPLGLVMLEQGWITSEQLRHALDAQKAAGQGKLGEWLVRQQEFRSSWLPGLSACNGAVPYCLWTLTMRTG
jgi:hypothetical protein